MRLTLMDKLDYQTDGWKVGLMDRSINGWVISWMHGWLVNRKIDG